MANSPLISVIVPVYNAERYVEQTLSCLLLQTYRNWEAILVDDCSKDGSVVLLQKYALLDQRFKVVLSDTNRGPSEARNEGLSRAQGKYVCFLDSDDYWSPEKLQVQLAFMVEKQVGFSFGGYFVVDETNSLRGCFVPRRPVVTYGDLLKSCDIGCLTVMLDREKFHIRFSPSMRGREDFALWLDLLRGGELAYNYGTVNAFYRVQSSSTSRNKLAMATRQWAVYRRQECYGVIKSTYFLIWYFVLGLIKNIYHYKGLKPGPSHATNVSPC